MNTEMKRLLKTAVYELLNGKVVRNPLRQDGMTYTHEEIKAAIRTIRPDACFLNDMPIEQVLAIYRK